MDWVSGGDRGAAPDGARAGGEFLSWTLRPVEQLIRFGDVFGTASGAEGWISLADWISTIAQEHRLAVSSGIAEIVAGERDTLAVTVVVERTAADHCWLRLVGRAVRNDDGSVASIEGAAHDVTGYMQAREVLTKAERSLQNAQTDASLGSWEWIRADSFDLIQVTPQILKIFGIEGCASTIAVSLLAERVSAETSAKVGDMVARLVAGDAAMIALEYEAFMPDGVTKWLRGTMRALLENGMVTGITGTVQDITDIRETEAERGLLAAALQNSINPFSIVDMQGYFLYVNQAFCDVFGFAAPGDVAGLYGRDIWNPADLADMSAAVESLRMTGQWVGQQRVTRPDGRERILQCSGNVVRDDAGKPLRVLTSYTDVTSLREAFRRLTVRETELREVQVLAGLGTWIYEPKREVFRLSDLACTMLGYPTDKDEVAATDIRALVVAEDRAALLADLSDVVTGRSPLRTSEMRVQTIDGLRRVLHATFRPVVQGGGQINSVYGIIQDITQLKEATAELETAQERLRTVMKHGEISVWDIEWDKGVPSILRGGDALVRILSPLSDMSVIGEPYRDELARLIEGMKRGDLEECVVTYSIVRPGGVTAWQRTTAWRTSPPGDPVPRYTGSNVDVTSEQEATIALEGIMAGAAVGLVTANDRGVILTVNAATEEIFGYEPGELVGRMLTVLMPAPMRGDHDGYLERFRQAQQINYFTRKPREFIGLRKDGAQFPIDLAVSFVELGGRKVLIGSVNDISIRKEAEAKFLQAQKLESVGHLTAGVAHDFNNLLMVIQIGTEFAKEACLAGGDASEHLDMVRDAAERGADLVRRLSIFSRQQDLEPKICDPCQLVRQALKLIRTALPETITTEIRFGDVVPQVNVDAGQMENALLNLAINARDAMPDGGNLIFEAHAVTRPAKDRQDIMEAHVRISVTDTGTGMDAETRSRALEPFFTTKELGKGTGLGLSMVYGFVTQSAGDVEIVSAPGEGTTISMYFPVAQGPAWAAVRARPGIAKGVDLGHVVLVDDEFGVRRALASLLKPRSSSLISAASGPEALTAIKDMDRIDLLVTDVVLPDRMTGFELADLVTARHPQCRVLLISGYSKETRPDYATARNYSMLHKPFSPQTFMAEVEALGKLVQAGSTPG